MLSRTQPRTHQQGFTLVELAIVLVIIGLIVGGVLVGQDLIKSAEIRATVSQIEKYNAAATTFRDKHGGLPGDILNSRVQQFGLTPARTTTGTAGEGNGDGMIQGTAANPSYLIGETLAFWSDLTQAALIPEAVQAEANMTTAGTLAVLPTTRMRESAVFHVYSDQGRNFFYIGTPAIAAGAVTPGAGISPFQAFSIDEKLDNGDGDEGIVIAVGVIEPNTELADANCMDATGLYNTTPGAADAIACSISVRASF